MDKRVIKTKKALTKALFDLLETNQINELTVSELCRKAAINRRTFYIHYSSIEEIFDDYRDSLSLQVYRALSVKNISAEDLLIIFDKILMANFRGFKYLCLNEKNHILIDELSHMLFETLCDALFIDAHNMDARVVIQYLSIGLINSYVYWFKNPKLLNYESLNRINKHIIETNLKLIQH